MVWIKIDAQHRGKLEHSIGREGTKVHLAWYYQSVRCGTIRLSAEYAENRRRALSLSLSLSTTDRRGGHHFRALKRYCWSSAALSGNWKVSLSMAGHLLCLCVFPVTQHFQVMTDNAIWIIPRFHCWSVCKGGLTSCVLQYEVWVCVCVCPWQSGPHTNCLVFLNSDNLLHRITSARNWLSAASRPVFHPPLGPTKTRGTATWNGP